MLLIGFRTLYILFYIKRKVVFVETNQTVATSVEVANLQPNTAESVAKREKPRDKPVYESLW